MSLFKNLLNKNKIIRSDSSTTEPEKDEKSLQKSYQSPISLWYQSISQKEFESEQCWIQNIDRYEDYATIYLSNGKSLNMVFFMGYPIAYNIWPEINDILFVEEKQPGEIVPIVYDQTANAYLFSKTTNAILYQLGKTFGMMAEFEGINDRNIIERLTTVMKQRINSPKYLFQIIETVTILGRIFKEERAKEVYITSFGPVQYSYNLEYSLDGKIRDHYITIRIEDDEIHSNISCIFNSQFHRKSGFTGMVRRTYNIPPLGVPVRINGGLHPDDGYVTIKDIWLGKNKLF
jgi:hypothetical protein